MALHPKVQEALIPANVVDPEPPDTPVPTEDPQYWFTLALREVMRGGRPGVGYLLEKYEAASVESKHSAQTIAAVTKANRICMAINCWNQAKINAGIKGTQIEFLVEGMRKWLEGTDLVPADLDIKPEMIQEVLAAEKE